MPEEFVNNEEDAAAAAAEYSEAEQEGPPGYRARVAAAVAALVAATIASSAAGHPTAAGLHWTVEVEFFHPLLVRKEQIRKLEVIILDEVATSCHSRHPIPAIVPVVIIAEIVAASAEHPKVGASLEQFLASFVGDVASQSCRQASSHFLVSQGSLQL